MKVYQKALVVAGLCVSMAAGLVGCGNATLDGSKAVATVGEKTITLGEANFLLRYQQAETEYYYESMLGEGFYNMDLMGDGSTYGETVKGDVMTQLQEYVILEDMAADYGVVLTEEETAKITEAAEAFLAANSDDTKAQMTADQETVERVLTMVTVGMKTSNAVVAEAEITLTEEEIAEAEAAAAAEETEADLESLLQTKQSEYYNEVMTGWKAENPITIDETVWADVKFNNSYELVTAE